MTRLLSLAFLLVAGPAALAQPPDPFIGTFNSVETGISLVMDRPSNRYEGLFSAQGNQYTCTATRQGNMLSGNYVDNRRPIGFTLTIVTGGYMLVTEGVRIPMQRTAQALSSVSVSASGTTVGPTTPRSSGQPFSDPYSGFRFNGPVGWTVLNQQGGWAFQQAGRQTVLTVSPHQYNSVDAVLNDVSSQQDAASHTSLQAQKERYGANGALVTFSGTLKGQSVVFTVLTLVSPHGGGVSLTAIAPRAEHVPELPQTLKAMAASVVFSRPQVSAVARQWQQRLSGRQLLHFYTTTGFSEKQSFDLCANGTFVYTTDASASSSGFGDSFSAVTQDGHSGSWRVITEGNQVVLVFNYRTGRVARLTVTTNGDGSSLLLNGKKYLMQASPMCR